jgi:hypothetical protein
LTEYFIIILGGILGGGEPRPYSVILRGGEIRPYSVILRGGEIRPYGVILVVIFSINLNTFYIVFPIVK